MADRLIQYWEMVRAEMVRAGKPPAWMQADVWDVGTVVAFGRSLRNKL